MSAPIAVIRGFAEVLKDRATVLAETAERPEEIDVERAKAALERAKKRIATGMSASEMDWSARQLSLQRALVRLKVRNMRRAAVARL